MIFYFFCKIFLPRSERPPLNQDSVVKGQQTQEKRAFECIVLGNHHFLHFPQLFYPFHGHVPQIKQHLVFGLQIKVSVVIEWCLTRLSTVFQSYHGDSSNYSCLSWVSPVLGWVSEVSCPRTLPQSNQEDPLSHAGKISVL